MYHFSDDTITRIITNTFLSVITSPNFQNFDFLRKNCIFGLSGTYNKRLKDLHMLGNFRLFATADQQYDVAHCRIFHKTTA